MGMTEESDENGLEGSVRFGEEDSVYENECCVLLEDTFLNQYWYSNNDECEVVTRLALKHGTVLQGVENEIFKQLSIVVYKKGKGQLKSLHGIPKTKVKSSANKVNCVL